MTKESKYLLMITVSVDALVALKEIQKFLSQADFINQVCLQKSEHKKIPFQI